MDDPMLPVKIYGRKKLLGVWVYFDSSIERDREILNMPVDNWHIGLDKISYEMFILFKMLIVNVDDVSRGYEL